MKYIILALVLSFLTGCMSSSWKINDEEYDAFINKECITTRDLYLNKSNSKATYAFHPYQLSFMEAVSYEGNLVANIPTGCKIFITEAGREKGGDGHVWDYLIGEIKVQKTGKPIKFEYLVGLAKHQQRKIPFKPITN